VIRWSPLAGSCEQGNTPSNSIKDKEFLGQLSEYQLLKRLCRMELFKVPQKHTCTNKMKVFVL
jgi:hypothetical protein